MITGFNTDVQHEGHTYHVQTEDRGRETPVLESLVYVGGTIIAKKSTPYADQLHQGATEEMIASLLKRQHQVIIAAIKAGRIEDLVRHSAKTNGPEKPVIIPAAKVRPPSSKLQPPSPEAEPSAAKDPVGGHQSIQRHSPPNFSPPAALPSSQTKQAIPPTTARQEKPAGLDLDEVISDYLKRSSEQGKLDLKVLSPDVFMAGKSIALRVQISYGSRPEADAVVTIKIIGTAFKPQVYIGRSGRDGIASFALALPAFNAGTAAIVIEAQSSSGRGELKHLIRRS